MDIDKNARSTPLSRMLMVQRVAADWPIVAVAVAQGVAPKTVRKWRDRYAAEGAAGLSDRSSRPHHSPTRLADDAEDEIEHLRRQRLSSSHRATPGPAPLNRRRCLASPQTRAALSARSEADDHPLRARKAGRTGPYRYQEARPYRGNWSSDHRRSHRSEQSARRRAWSWLGVPARRHR